MMKRIVMLIFAGILMVSGFSGCYTMGKATGEVADAVDKEAENFEEGYEEGKD